MLVDEGSGTGLRSPLLTRVLAGVLGLLLVASVVWLVVAARDASDDSESPQQGRDAVMVAARAYTLAASNYSPDDLDDSKQLTGYRDRVAPLITASYKPALDAWLARYTDLVVQGLRVETVVDRVGVEEMDSDSASVLVGGSSVSSLEKQVLEDSGFTKRLRLVKVGGRWLVNDDPEDLAVAAGQPGTPQGTPSAEPTETPNSKGTQE
ncbi:hypothetical protein ACLM5J_01885 [Nocardioides sp. Bht2]|uniref:hypothetical protein n=1 Tax=Nocardioides sp. Bht2 TaxID=3392297 RepID=UPI0039B50D2F